MMSQVSQERDEREVHCCPSVLCPTTVLTSSPPLRRHKTKHLHTTHHSYIGHIEKYHMMVSRRRYLADTLSQVRRWRAVIVVYTIQCTYETFLRKHENTIYSTIHNVEVPIWWRHHLQVHSYDMVLAYVVEILMIPWWCVWRDVLRCCDAEMLRDQSPTSMVLWYSSVLGRV